MFVIGHVGAGGWQLVWLTTDTPAPIRVRFAQGEDGRLEIAEVHMVGAPVLPASTFRQIPWSQVEAMANGPYRDELLQRIAESGAKVETATDRWLRTVGGGEKEPTVRLAPQRRPPLRLDVPKGPKRPDSFYKRVAKMYLALAASGSHRPAQEIADANGVPVTTVHRWTKEARARGLLGSGRQGKAG